MLVTVVVCTHDLNNYENLVAAVRSLLAQTHRELEIVVVVDGNERLSELVAREYAGSTNVRVVPQRTRVGASGAKNAGIKVATGEVVAFLDDDAVAEPVWVGELLETYADYDAVGVGGRIVPIWLGSPPAYLPEELYWLVGGTHEGFAGEKVAVVRNTFASNMSFKRQVFEEVGLFSERFGLVGKGTSYVQAEEPEFALRVTRKLGRGVMYNPKAVVRHRVPPSKATSGVLLRRAFYQGYSKALLRRSSDSPDAIATEKSYLKGLLTTYIPRRVKRAYRMTELEKLSFLMACVGVVGLGFAYGYVRGRVPGWKRR